MWGDLLASELNVFYPILSTFIIVLLSFHKQSSYEYFFPGSDSNKWNEDLINLEIIEYMIRSHLFVLGYSHVNAFILDTQGIASLPILSSSSYHEVY